jgi:hypothetical protein
VAEPRDLGMITATVDRQMAWLAGGPANLGHT